MVDKENVGRAIAEQRKIKGMTQKNLADLLHVSYQAVSRWEQGISLPSVDMVYDIAKTLETTVDFLLNGLSEKRRVIDYMDTGLDTHRLYMTKERLDNLITKEDFLLHATYIDPVFMKPAILGMEEPVCVFANHVPGSKERFAMENGYDREICIDLVSCAANNMVRYGVKPSVLHANMVCGNNDGGQILTMGEAFKEACEDNGIAFAGMEVSAQAVNYHPGEYQLKAMVMGYVDRKKIITGEQMEEGDILIGLHTDGIAAVSYPFIKVILDRIPNILYTDIGGNQLFADKLMEPAACYANVVSELHQQNLLHGVFNISNSRSLFSRGRFYSIPRGLGAGITLSSIPIPPLFRFLYDLNMMDRECFFENFNLGVGMVLAVPRAQYEMAAGIIERYHKCTVIGKIDRDDEHPDTKVWIEGALPW